MGQKLKTSKGEISTRILLEKWVNVPIDQVAQKLNGENWLLLPIIED